MSTSIRNEDINLDVLFNLTKNGILKKFFKKQSNLDECVLGSFQVKTSVVDQALVDQITYPRGRQTWKCTSRDFKPIVRSEANYNSSSKELTCLNHDESVIELRVHSDWLQHEKGWSRIGLKDSPILEKDIRLEYKASISQQTLIVTNHSLYLGSVLASEGSAEAHQNQLYQDFQRYPLKEILMINTPYTSSEDEDVVLRSNTIVLHCRRAPEKHLWLQCETGLRSPLVELISDAFTRLTGTPFILSLSLSLSFYNPPQT